MDSKKDLAVKLFLSGKSKYKIRQRLHIGDKKLDMWINQACGDKKKIALCMFFYWYNSRNHICSNLNIDIDMLDRWIIEKVGGIRNLASHMYYKRLYPRERICKELKITPVQLNEWLDGENENVIPFEKVNEQPGFSKWVTSIINKNHKIS